VKQPVEIHCDGTFSVAMLECKYIGTETSVHSLGGRNHEIYSVRLADGSLAEGVWDGDARHHIVVA